LALIVRKISRLLLSKVPYSATKGRFLLALAGSLSRCIMLQMMHRSFGCRDHCIIHLLCFTLNIRLVYINSVTAESLTR